MSSPAVTGASNTIQTTYDPTQDPSSKSEAAKPKTPLASWPKSAPQPLEEFNLSIVQDDHPDAGKLQDDQTLLFPDGRTEHLGGKTTHDVGTVYFQDGSYRLPNGELHRSDGFVEHPDGRVQDPDGFIYDNAGMITHVEHGGNGDVRYSKNLAGLIEVTTMVPDPVTREKHPQFETKLPFNADRLDGDSIVYKDGSIRHPDGKIEGMKVEDMKGLGLGSTGYSSSQLEYMDLVSQRDKVYQERSETATAIYEYYRNPLQYQHSNPEFNISEAEIKQTDLWMQFSELRNQIKNHPAHADLKGVDRNQFLDGDGDGRVDGYVYADGTREKEINGEMMVQRPPGADGKPNPWLPMPMFRVTALGGGKFAIDGKEVNIENLFLHIANELSVGVKEQMEEKTIAMRIKNDSVRRLNESIAELTSWRANLTDEKPLWLSIASADSKIAYNDGNGNKATGRVHEIHQVITTLEQFKLGGYIDENGKVVADRNYDENGNKLSTVPDDKLSSSQIDLGVPAHHKNRTVYSDDHFQDTDGDGDGSDGDNGWVYKGGSTGVGTDYFLKAAQLDAYIQKLKGKVEELNSNSQLEMIDLQELVSQNNRFYDMASNVISKAGNNRQTIAGNIRA